MTRCAKDCATWATTCMVVTLMLLTSVSASAQTISTSTSATESASQQESSTTCEKGSHICAVDGFILGENYWMEPGYYYTARAHHLAQVELEREPESSARGTWIALSAGLSAGLIVGLLLGAL